MANSPEDTDNLLYWYALHYLSGDACSDETPEETTVPDDPIAEPTAEQKLKVFWGEDFRHD